MALNIPGTVYRVGGSVRDELLGIHYDSNKSSVRDCDWVVTGTTPDAMEQAGLRQVGKAFPVFLDPNTGDQYALARTEKKIGQGHQAFEFCYDSNVALADDLKRRDLTINAMARDSSDNLIDPYGGERDLEMGVLRHVSQAFAEDPLRVFRVARFAATLPDFDVAPETLELMSTMQDELATLSAERVWHEYFKAMQGLAPYKFFDTLIDSSVIDPWFRGVAVRDLRRLLLTRQLRNTHAVAAVGWVHDEEITVDLLRRLKAPRKQIRMARDVSRHGHKLSEINAQESSNVLALLERAHAFRQGDAFKQLVDNVEAFTGLDLGGILGIAAQLRDIRPLHTPSSEYGVRLRQARLEAIDKYLR